MTVDPEPAPTPDSAPDAARRHDRALEVGVAILCAGAVLISGVGLGRVLGQRGAGRAAPAATAARPSALQLQPQPASVLGGRAAVTGAEAVAARVAPGIVDVDVTLAGGGAAAGTGMIVSAQGEVLTNNHVVKGSSAIRVTIAGHADGHAAHVVAVDPTADVALVQVEGVSGWPAVTLADTSTLAVGEPVVAIGNALGRGGAPSVTSGTITALNRSITAADGSGTSEDLAGLIETDASISPGDSGGALANAAGQVVGMITAGETSGSRRRSVSVAGYAVPAGTAAAVVQRIRAGDPGADIVRTSPAYLGVSVTAADAATSGRVSGGALVARVVSGSPAAAAGIAAGAVITGLGGVTVDTPDALGSLVRAHAPGDRVTVTWSDSGGRHTQAVVLVAGPPV